MNSANITINPHDSVIALVKGLSKGPCSCTHEMGSCSWTYDAKSGRTDAKCDPGPKTTCLRCRAREALERDGIDYEKVDHLPLMVRL